MIIVKLFQIIILIVFISVVMSLFRFFRMLSQSQPKQDDNGEERQRSRKSTDKKVIELDDDEYTVE